MTTGQQVQVTASVALDTWYDRRQRVWWACYRDTAGNQLGNAWHGTTRDECLVFRLPTPAPGGDAPAYGYRID